MTLSDLKNICNYSQKKVVGSQTTLMYLDILSSEDEEYQRMIKQQNRELVVDAILDDKVEELNIFRENQVTDVTDVSNQYNSSQMGIISPKIMQINMTASKFQTYQKLCDEVVDFLNKNTKNPKIFQHGNQGLDIKLQGDYDTDYRKIISKTLMCSNLIAMDGRIGPVKSVIFGKKLLPYLKDEDTLANVTYYYSDLLDDDKVIVCRVNNIDQPGLLLIDDQENGQYFFNQTPNWHKQYCWFKII
jgi:hypothetical protein